MTGFLRDAIAAFAVCSLGAFGSAVAAAAFFGSAIDAPVPFCNKPGLGHELVISSVVTGPAVTGASDCGPLLRQPTPAERNVSRLAKGDDEGWLARGVDRENHGLERWREETDT